MNNLNFFFIFTIVLALVSDFMNGFHDAANSIATVISTRVLKPQMAIIWAAFFNVISFLFFGLHVAGTIGHDIVSSESIQTGIIFSALLATISWNVFTWYFGIPSSSSHALLGGLAGAVYIKVGASGLYFLGFLKILIALLTAPVCGFFFSCVLMMILRILFSSFTPKKADQIARKCQLFSASLYSLGHGGNDAQKTMGIISLLLFSQGYLGDQFSVPLWVILSCQVAMGLGTLCGGWRIVKTLGVKITKLKPIGGISAELGGALTLFIATFFGIPVSTTHIITGSIMGAGSAQKLSGVRWIVAKKIFLAWIMTFPISALLAIFISYCLDYFHVT